jgi:microcystin-dependent protein
MLVISILVLLTLLVLYLSYDNKNKVSKLLRSSQDTEKQPTFLTIDEKGNINNSTLGVPNGTIVMFNGIKIPDGWALCNGELGTPDLRGRFILGAGKGENLTNRVLNEKGGKETVTLTTNEIPEHKHDLIDPAIGVKSVLPVDLSIMKAFDNGSAVSGFVADRNQVVPLKDIKMTSVGEGKPYDNMPPYYVLSYIMKIK